MKRLNKIWKLFPNTIKDITKYLILEFKTDGKIEYPVNFPLRNFHLKTHYTSSIGKETLFKNLEIHEKTEIGQNNVLDGSIQIGKYSTISENCEFRGEVKIGKYCNISRNCLFQAKSHDYSKTSIINSTLHSELLNSKIDSNTHNSIEIGHDVWIGTRAIIMPGVKIGNGAGAIVTKNVDPYEIVAGVPAKNISYRFPEEKREKLSDLKWWDWNSRKIKRNKKFLESSADFSKVK